MLKFAKSVPYIPDPARSRPHITAEQRNQAAETPPHVVPFQCKPWVDGQSIGWTLFYGWLTPITITGTEAGGIVIGNLEQLSAETQQPKIADQFAADHFGLSTGYTLQTPPGWLSLIMPATSPPPHLRALTGVIESDWYPRQLFLVFEIPPPGVTIALDYQMPLARVVVVPRQAGWQAQPLTDTEKAALEAQRSRYLAEEAQAPRWTAAGGAEFTHLYKQWSRRYQPPEQPADDA
jgi:hypothetical protein